jgi:hypothetical protein
LKKWLPPIVLGVASVVLGLLAYLLLPSERAIAPPPYVSFSIEANQEVGLITFAAHQSSPTAFQITISADIFPSAAGYPGTNEPASLLVFLPAGVTPETCPPSVCINLLSKYSWHALMAFDKNGTATVTIPVHADVFGYAANGLTASAAIPEARYQGRGHPQLQVHYEISSAASYDWSSFPTAFADDRQATWTEEMLDRVVPTRTAVGINHSEERRDSLATFVAGALVGLAGGALLSAIQEWLHASD